MSATAAVEASALAATAVNCGLSALRGALVHDTSHRTPSDAIAANVSIVPVRLPTGAGPDDACEGIDLVLRLLVNFVLYERPEPGIPTVILVPRGPMLTVAPLRPTLRLGPDRDKLTLMPGARRSERLNLNPIPRSPPLNPILATHPAVGKRNVAGVRNGGDGNVGRFRNELTRVPAVRIGVGRSGLSTSIDWQGDPRGGQSIHRRLEGLRTLGDPRLAGPLPTDRFLIPGTRSDFGGGSVSAMTSPGLESFKALLLAAEGRKREITADKTKAKWQLRLAWTARAVGWATLACAVAKPLRAATQHGVETRRREIATLDSNLAATAVTVDFDMESEVGPLHLGMQEAFDRIAASHRTWSIQSSQQIDRVKARSFAGTVVGRRLTALSRTAHTLVSTAHPPLAWDVQGGRATAYFYPGFVLVAERAGGFALIDLVDLDVSAAYTNFTETEGVPTDSTVVGKTWAKANKNGSRDRRFANNKELPIARYGQLHLASSGGLNEAFMTSRAEPCAEFAGAVLAMKRLLMSSRGNRKFGKQGTISETR